MIVILSDKKSLKKLTAGFAAVFILIFIVPSLIRSKMAAVSASSLNSIGYVVLVIDDFGNGAEGTKEMIELEIAFTGAVMPGLKFSEKDAEDLHANGKDVILHMPMEPHSGKKSWLGPVALTADKSTGEIIRLLNESIRNVPHIVGINNHMGSKATEDARILTEVLKVCKDNQLLFLDSKTSPKSKASELGSDLDVTVLERDIFLDSTDSIDKIEKNLLKAANIALKNGHAVAIGHVGEDGGMVTVNAIKNKYKEMQEMGIIFITISELNGLIGSPLF